MITRIDHINIVVSNLEEAESFFRLLGFKEKDSSTLSGEWISTIVGLEDVRARYVALSLPDTDLNVELIAYASPPSGGSLQIDTANRIGFRHLALAVKDIEAEVERLKVAGVVFKSPIQIFPRTGKKLVYFNGPDGILLELAEYPEAT
jgi:catechol 2,3-dioxygenase-like lactoylglutathione lyase family enzyme